MREIDKKLLWGKSGNRCAIQNCRRELSEAGNPEAVIGEMAHIRGEAPSAARYDQNMTDEERDAYANRILLCPTHHTIIDKQVADYSVEILNQIKSDHEGWVRETLEKEMPHVTFAELEVITSFLTDNGLDEEDNLTIIPPREKIRKNNLSAGIERHIKLGMVQSKQVKEYIDKNLDSDYGERLKKGFVSKYQELYQEGLRGDDLFDALRSYAAGGTSDFKRQAAGLAVLTYFFEACEVFER